MSVEVKIEPRIPSGYVLRVTLLAATEEGLRELMKKHNLPPASWSQGGWAELEQPGS